jgi:sec-independent protein translocase protein TatC
LSTTEKSSLFSRLRSKDPVLNRKEMSFIDHLEALRWHIVRSLLVWIALAIVIFIYKDWVFDNIIYAPASSDFISYSALCNFGHFIHIGDALCMPPVNIPLQGNTVSGPFIAALNIAMIGGLIAAFPYLFYELWSFIKPALSAKELKYGEKSIFWVSICFFTGAAFGYFVLAPFTFNFLANFQIGKTGAYKYLPTLDDYISTLNNLLLGCGISFELPVLAFVLAKIGLITAKFLKFYRKYAYIVILILAAILTPSPDWISQAIVALPLVLLYEISILLVKKIDREKKKEEAQWE